MLLALRLLLVWFGTASVTLWIAHRFVRPIRARVAVFLAFIPFFLLGKALITGGVYAPIDIAYTVEPLASLRSELKIGEPRTPMLSDVAYQEIPWRKAVREAVK